MSHLGLRPGERVLDTPCGTGPSLVDAAHQVGPTGRVVGIDYAEQMAAIARRKVCAENLANVEVRVGDMTAIEPPGDPFDAVLCALGLFFVDDMPSLLRSFWGLVRPQGGRIGVGVFGERFFDPMRDVFVRAVGLVAPGAPVVEPWRRVDDPAVLRQVFAAAGIDDVAIETHDDNLPLPSPADWWRIVMGSGLRRTITTIGDRAARQVRAICDAYIAGQTITEVVARARYATAMRR